MAEKEVDEFFKTESRLADDGGFLKFLWNSDTKEFCGRNGISWLRITVFYIIFYLLLSGFWILMLLVFYQTLDYYKPTWQLDDSRIGTNPGLGFRPVPRPDDIDSTLIWFAHGSNGDWQHWVDNLDEYLKPYKPGRQSGEHVNVCDFGKNQTAHVCKFVLETMGSHCSKANSFGYDVGRPCILIKLNRIFNWKPEPYTSNASFPPLMPKRIRDIYDPNYVYISCAGENPADQENIGPITYYPENGVIPNFYFPFTNLDGYLSPFVFVHFKKPTNGVIINIECKAWAANIKHDRTDRLGSVHLELLVD